MIITERKTKITEQLIKLEMGLYTAGLKFIPAVLNSKLAFRFAKTNRSDSH